MDTHKRYVSQKISRLESIFNDTPSSPPNSILRSFPRFSTLTDGSVFRYQVMGSRTRPRFPTCTRIYFYVNVPARVLSYKGSIVP